MRYWACATGVPADPVAMRAHEAEAVERRVAVDIGMVYAETQGTIYYIYMG